MNRVGGVEVPVRRNRITTVRDAFLTRDSLPASVSRFRRRDKCGGSLTAYLNMTYSNRINRCLILNKNEHEKVFFINGRYYPLLVFAACQSDELANGGKTASSRLFQCTVAWEREQCCNPCCNGG